VPQAVEPLAPDVPPPEQTTRLTITTGTRTSGPASPAGASVVFQYSALAETAVIPLREQEVQVYFATRLPGRLMSAADQIAQENFGRLLASYLIPEDFLKLIEASEQLTVVLDPTTACYPWEMAAYKNRRQTIFFGPELKLTRQFRTLLSLAPGMAPAVNDELKVLVIANPAPGTLSLGGAREEGLAVVQTLEEVRKAWDGRLKVEVTVRIGAVADPTPENRAAQDQARATGDLVKSVAPCDPLELLTLLVDGEYDVVHSAGHGIFEQQQRRGWVLDQDCVLSAQEVFCVRQVPRLVFANACHSAEISPDAQRQQQQQQAGLAEAFFARGIQNYIGTGWAVDDALAKQFAIAFYRTVLANTAPPATLGDALAFARTEVLRLERQQEHEHRQRVPTWAAYQHYGQANAKLIAVPNRETPATVAQG
jgi:hypothetical protein